MAPRNISRRDLLKSLGVGLAGVGLAACGATPPVGPSTAATSATAAGQGATAAPPVAAGNVVQLEIKSIEPEYSAQSRQIWDVYEQLNPNVKVTLFDVNEDTQAAYNARIAAGNPADVETQAKCTKENYQQYVNLLEVSDFKFDIFHKDAKTAFEQIYGVPNYVPMVNPFQGFYFTFIYYKDKMAAAGLDPKTSVKTLDDLETFLAALKKHVDADPALDYVFDTGWHPWVVGTVFPSAMSVGLGHGKEEQRQLFLGKIRWDDMERNPFVAYFQRYKEWYDKGYLPQKWWTRNWDEYENGNIAQKSILTFHGPWQWDKIEAGNPAAGAQLDGFNFPADKDGNLYVTPTATYAFNTNAAAIYTANKNKANAPEALKALLWWYSPATIKLEAEAVGYTPACDLSSVGGANVKHTQYVTTIKPTLDGKEGKRQYDSSLHGMDVAAKYLKGGAENVMESDTTATLFGEYLEGKTTLEALMKTFQTRWESSYQIPA